MPSNVAAALACIPLIGGIIFYILEKRDNFVRFYAMQSILFGGAWFLFNIASKIVFLIFSSIPAIGGLLFMKHDNFVRFYAMQSFSSVVHGFCSTLLRKSSS